jgi:hypothetical protein
MTDPDLISALLAPVAEYVITHNNPTPAWA